LTTHQLVIQFICSLDLPDQPAWPFGRRLPARHPYGAGGKVLCYRFLDWGGRQSAVAKVLYLNNLTI
jgi:hypothetical protein